MTFGLTTTLDQFTKASWLWLGSCFVLGLLTVLFCWGLYWTLQKCGIRLTSGALGRVCDVTYVGSTLIAGFCIFHQTFATVTVPASQVQPPPVQPAPAPDPRYPAPVYLYPNPSR